MLKLTINKDDLGEATKMLAQVSALKSTGAIPAEGSCLQFTPTTVTLSNSNAANAIVINDIPIKVIEGDISEEMNKGIMVNTKKLCDLVKSAKDLVNIIITEDVITLKSGKLKIELSIYRVGRKKPVDIRVSATPVVLKEFTEKMVLADLITAGVENSPHLAGAFIEDNQMFCTNRVEALFIKNMGLENKLPDGIKSLFFNPDLFASCLTKSTEETGLIGITEDGSRIAVVLKNITLFKSIQGQVFPRDGMAEVINKILLTSVDNMLTSVVNITALISKFKEYQAIVESDKHLVSIHADGQIIISAANNKVGASGEVSIPVKDVHIPKGIEESLGGLYKTDSILLLSHFFGSSEEGTVRMSVNDVKGKTAAGSISIDSDKLLYFCTPRIA